MASGGTIRIKIWSAQLTRDTEIFGKMDPYCVIEYKDKKYQTNVKNEAGTKPVWNQSFNFFAELNRQIVFDVLEEDTFSSDQVGMCETTIEAIIPKNGADSVEHDLELNYGNEEAGTLKISVEFTPAPK